MLAPGYEMIDDADDGPLEPGMVGIVITDDGTEKPFQVKAPNGQRWWYCPAAIMAANSEDVSKDGRPSSPIVVGSTAWHCSHVQHMLRAEVQENRWVCDVCRQIAVGGVRMRCRRCDFDACNSCMLNGGHVGDFRGEEKKQWCSIESSRDGPLCMHAPGIITNLHWSCCGSLQDGAGCWAGARPHDASAGAVTTTWTGMASGMILADSEASLPPRPPTPPIPKVYGEIDWQSNIY